MRDTIFGPFSLALFCLLHLLASKARAFQGPTTCGCDRSKVNSACPQPQGLTCDTLGDCVLIESAYVCRGDVPSLLGFLEIDLADDLLDAWQAEVLQGLGMVLADVAGVAPAAVRTAVAVPGAPPTRRLDRRLRIEGVEFEIFLTASGAEPGEVETTLSSTSLDTVTASCQTQLQELTGVDLAVTVQKVQTLATFGRS